MASHEQVLQRVSKLTSLMKQRGITHYIVPGEDAHQSEYIAAQDKRRAFISGFTGSAGLALVSEDGSGKLWTDGRYYTQADRQLDPNHWKLMKFEGPSLEKWLSEVKQC